MTVFTSPLTIISASFIIGLFIFLGVKYLWQKRKYNEQESVIDGDVLSPYQHLYHKTVIPHQSGKTNFYISGTWELTTGSYKIDVFEGLDTFINTAPKMEISKEKEYECIYCRNIYTKRVDECIGCGSRKIKEIVE